MRGALRRIPLVLLAVLLIRPAAAETPAEQPYEGVSILRIVRAEPRPLRAWIVRVDLDAPGVSVEASPGGERNDGIVTARRVRTVLRDEGYALCVNASVHDPAEVLEGDPVRVEGPAIHAGRLYAHPNERRAALCVDADGSVSVRISPLAGVREAVAGFDVPPCLVRGRITGPDDRRHPRTAAGVSRDGRTLILLVADGRQPGLSEGLTLHEVAALLLEHGAFNGINLDGGGSTTLAIAESDGKARVLNVPVGLILPGTEGAVGTCLGIRARRIATATPPPVPAPKTVPARRAGAATIVVLGGALSLLLLVALLRSRRSALRAILGLIPILAAIAYVALRAEPVEEPSPSPVSTPAQTAPGIDE